MSKEQLGLIVLLVGLFGTVLTAGIRIGSLTERIAAQTEQIKKLSDRVDALSSDWAGSRVEMMRILATR